MDGCGAKPPSSRSQERKANRREEEREEPGTQSEQKRGGERYRGEHEAMVTREERGELSTALLWLGGGVGGADTTAATAAAAACGGVIGWLFGYGADKLGLPVVLSVTGWLLVCISMVWMVVL